MTAPCTDNATAPITPARTAQALAETMTATDLYNLYRNLRERVARAAYPALTLVTEEEDGTATYGFKCPHCDQTVNEITVLDTANRYVTSGTVRDDEVNDKVLTVYYDGTADYETLTYLCTDCYQPVNLPEGWKEA